MCSKWSCCTSLQPLARNPQRRLCHERLACCCIAVMRRLLLESMEGRVLPLCHTRKDWQITSCISGSEALSISHLLRFSMDSSQKLIADASLHKRTFSMSSFVCPHLGQSECSCHFHWWSHFPTPQMPEFYFESQCCQLDGRAIELFFAMVQSIEVMDASLKKFLSFQYCLIFLEEMVVLQVLESWELTYSEWPFSAM